MNIVVYRCTHPKCSASYEADLDSAVEPDAVYHYCLYARRELRLLLPEEREAA